MSEPLDLDKLREAERRFTTNLPAVLAELIANGNTAGNLYAEDVSMLTTGARAIVDGERLGWCAFHRAAGDMSLDCWGAGINGQDSCEILPVVVIPVTEGE